MTYEIKVIIEEMNGKKRNDSYIVDEYVKYNEHIGLVLAAERLIQNGMHDLDPVVRSIYRRTAKLYREMSKEEQEWADNFNDLPFH